MNSFFTKNVTAKVLSILFALILWIYVMSEINPRTTKPESNLPVQLIGVEEIRAHGLVIEGVNNYTVNVRVTGRRDEIQKITRNDIKAVADIRGYRVGTNSIPVEITGPQGLEIDYSPKFIKLELEEIVKRQKEVSLIISGSPPEGYVMGEAEYKPTIVWVEGPESSVNSIERIIAKLEILQDTIDIAASLPLKAVNSKGAEVTNIDIKSPYIDVILPIDRINQIPIKPDLDLAPQEGYEITGVRVIPEEISLRGADELVNSITTVATEKLTKENITESFDETISLKIPEGVQVVGDTSVRISVEVERISEETFVLSRDSIVFTNVRRGLTVNKGEIPENIEVKITAPASIIENLNQRSIRLIVDLKDEEAGEHKANLIVELPYEDSSKTKSIETNPKQITIRLEANN